MSRRNKSKSKKKRWSRKMRKFMKLGKVRVPKNQHSMVQSEKVSNETPTPDPGVAEKKETASTERPPSSIDRKTEDDWRQKEKKVSPDKAKFQEIHNHLKNVILISISCLLIIAILYYLERQTDWVNLLNIKIKDAMAGWNWKI